MHGVENPNNRVDVLYISVRLSIIFGLFRMAARRLLVETVSNEATDKNIAAFNEVTMTTKEWTVKYE